MTPADDPAKKAAGRSLCQWTAYFCESSSDICKKFKIDFLDDPVKLAIHSNIVS